MGGEPRPVCWDHLVFSLQGAGGISGWWLQHCRVLAPALAGGLAHLGPYAQRSLPLAEALARGEADWARAPRQPLPPWWWLAGAPVPAAALYHPSYYRMPRRAGRLLITFHDIDHGARGARAGLRHRLMRRCLLRADAVHCISRHAARQLRDWLPAIPEARVRVIHHGALPLPEPCAAPPAPGLGTRPFVLWVGARRGYKRGDLALRAGRALDGADVVLVGGEPLAADERAALGARLLHLPAADGPALAWLYRHAAALWYLSANEGFGFPVLEAAAHGCPVLAQAGHAVEEIAGGYAHLHPAPDADWVVATTRPLLARPPGEREARLAEGRALAAGFTWERYRDAMLALYRDVG